MASTDTFEWFVRTQLTAVTPSIEQFIREQRAYLLTLRSEDERQRFVERIMRELKRLSDPGRTAPGRRGRG